ncbi:hypothetical protein DFH08DRAFT_1081091 [Mycena albidolilacea]|uniref:Uncharacterized protein n=1 Tax=Mycena albidolilacea TaxID=1033008 RepID=A0AAD6ZYU7_9AGAR|nr:hypothetical protein DFH08DRAFT_1081091 [Mycena albidolilacea]
MAAFGTRRGESDNTNPILELAFGTRFSYGSVGSGKQHRRSGLRFGFAARVSVDDEYVRYGEVRPSSRALEMPHNEGFGFTFISFGAPVALAISMGHAIAPRQYSVFACLDANFAVGCVFFDSASGECVNFAAPYDNAISSFSTDDSECTIFVQVLLLHVLDPDCYSASLGGITPAANLTSLPPGFDEAISLFKCLYDE